MDQYFDKEVEDLVVPNDCERSNMMSSPESWSEWGMTGFGGSDFPKKNLNSNTNMTREELTLYTSFEADDSKNERWSSYNCGSLLWNDDAHYRKFTEEEARIKHMDDLFFNSLLEEDPTEDSNKMDEGFILADNDNIFEGEMVNSHGSYGQSMGSSKYRKTRNFSPSMEWVNEEASTTCLMPKQHTSDENSMEESVLHDLERVTSQFTEKTRMCFRDALYRLAESSKQSCHEDEPMLTSDADALGTQETEVLESKTNGIDRAVANLMFNKFDFVDNEDGNTEEHHEHEEAVSFCERLTDHLSSRVLWVSCEL